MLVCAESLGLLLLCRVVMGLGEGVTFPCIQNLVATDVPGDNKAQSLSLIYSGVQVRLNLLLCPESRLLCSLWCLPPCSPVAAPNAAYTATLLGTQV